MTRHPKNKTNLDRDYIVFTYTCNYKIALLESLDWSVFFSNIQGFALILKHVTIQVKSKSVLPVVSLW